MIATGQSDDRLLFLLQMVEKEGRHLIGTTGRLFSDTIDALWVQRLEDHPELAERTDAFATRFGRMQDTLGAALDNLNRMEKLGLLASVTDWMEARNLRNRLVHEYMRDEAEFAGALNRAAELVPLLVSTYNAMNAYARHRFGASAPHWPAPLPPARCKP